MDKVGFAYGGRSPNFDPAPYYSPINKIRDEGRVLDGAFGSDGIKMLTSTSRLPPSGGRSLGLCATAINPTASNPNAAK